MQIAFLNRMKTGNLIILASGMDPNIGRVSPHGRFYLCVILVSKMTFRWVAAIAVIWSVNV
jgi:hypothetical protein